jgi:hypothetical protein
LASSEGLEEDHPLTVKLNRRAAHFETNLLSPASTRFVIHTALFGRVHAPRTFFNENGMHFSPEQGGREAILNGILRATDQPVARQQRCKNNNTVVLAV